MSGNLTKLAVATAIGGATIIGLATAASAHDFTIGVGAVTCVDGHKQATVTVNNTWDTDAKGTNESSLFFSVAAHSSFSFPRSAPGNQAGSSYKGTVQLDWGDLIKQHTYVVNWGNEPCEGMTTTTPAPTTTVPGCPEGQTYSPVPPVGCYPAVVVPPTEPPATNPAPPTTIRVCIDGNAPSIPVEDGSLVCPEFFPPTTQAPVVIERQVVQSTPAKPIALPATGASSTQMAGIGLIIGLAGLGAVLFTRKRAEAE